MQALQYPERCRPYFVYANKNMHRVKWLSMKNGSHAKFDMSVPLEILIQIQSALIYGWQV